MKKSRAGAFLWLLLIPAQLVLDAGLLCLGAWADTALAQTGTQPGHPAPGLVLLAALAAAVLTLAAAIAAVILTVRAYRRAGRKPPEDA